MSTVVKYLKYPLDGKPRKFVIENKDDWDTYKRYKANWEGWVPPGGHKLGSPEMRSQGERQLRGGAEFAQAMAPDLAAMAAGGAAGAARLPFIARVAAQGLAGGMAAPVAGRDPVREGLGQSALSVPGEALAGIGRASSLGLARKGVEAAPELKASFGDIGGSMLHERLGVSNPMRLSEGPEKAGVFEWLVGNKTPFTGSAAAAYKLDQLKRGSILPLLAADPTEHSLDDILMEVRQRLQKQVGKRPTGKSAMWDELDRVFAEAKAENFSKLDNTALWDLKSGAQEQSVDLLRNRNRVGQSDAAALAKADAEERFNAEFQKVANERLARLPGYKKLNDRYRELVGVKWALEEAETGREATASARAVAGGGKPRVAFNPEGAQSRTGMTAAARVIGNPVTDNILRNLPRLAQMGVRAGDPTADIMDFLTQWQAERKMREMNPLPNRPALPTDPAGPR